MDEDCVRYFAVGSNLHRSRLRTRGTWLGHPDGVQYRSAEAAVLRGFRLVMNTPGFPPAEPVFGSAVRCECNRRSCVSEVHGVVYTLDRHHYDLLWMTEGGLGGREHASSYVEQVVQVELYGSSARRCSAVMLQTRPQHTVWTVCARWLPPHGYRRRWLGDEFQCRARAVRKWIDAGADADVGGADSKARAMHAHVLQGMLARPSDDVVRIAFELEHVIMCPSERYMGIVRDGARESGLEEAYVAYLDAFLNVWRGCDGCAPRPRALRRTLSLLMRLSTPSFFLTLLQLHRWRWHRVAYALSWMWSRWFLAPPFALFMERELHAIRIASARRTGRSAAAVCAHWLVFWVSSLLLALWVSPTAMAGLAMGTLSRDFFNIRAHATHGRPTPVRVGGRDRERGGVLENNNNNNNNNDPRLRQRATRSHTTS